jgi:MFS family permease
MVKPLLVDRALDLSDIGFLSGTVGSVMGLLGALLGGLGVQRMGRKRALLVFGVGQAASVVAYAAAAEWSSWDRLFAATALEHLAGGAATVSLFTAMMDRCRPHREGTDYTVQASLVVFATGTAASLSGFLAQNLGYPLHFLLSFVVCLGGVALVAAGWEESGDATGGAG